MKKFSLIVSYVCCIVGFCVLVAACFYMPLYANGLFDFHGCERVAYPLLLVLRYLVLALVAFADLCLFLLLEAVRKGQVFTRRSVLLLKLISYSAILTGLLFLPFGFYLPLAFALVFIGLFLGMVLRVVMQVIRKGVELQEENDATI